MAHRVSPEAETDLDSIWLYIAQESGSAERAQRVIESITSRFHLLSNFPYLGRARDLDFGAGRRSFPADAYVIVYRIDDEGSVLILRVLHGRRDLPTILRPPRR